MHIALFKRQMKKLEKENIEDILALAPMQEGILFHYLKDLHSDYYFEQLSLSIQGKIEIEIFEEAWNFVIETNEMLRTVFRWENLENPIQIILKEHKLQPGYYDFFGMDDNETQKRLEQLKIEDRKKKFDLRQVPFRITLCKIKNDKYEMIISNHHILYDGWSNGIILNEFFTAYQELRTRGEFRQDIKIKTKFKGFVQWIQNQNKKNQEQYWREYLQGVTTRTEIPVKINRRKRTQTKGPGSYHLRFTKDLQTKIEEFVKVQKITLASFLYSSWGILLQKYNNCDDVMFGTIVSGRSAKVKGIQDMVGLFLNTIPLRVHTHPHENMPDLLYRVHKGLQTREVYEHTPLINIKEYSKLDNIEALFDSIVALENYPLVSPSEGKNTQLSVNSFRMFENTNYDLTVSITVFNVIEMNFIYQKEVFAEDDIMRMGSHFRMITEDIVNYPGKKIFDLAIISEEERDRILYEFNNTEVQFPKDKTIQLLFEEQAERTPDRIAVVGQSLGGRAQCENEKRPALCHLHCALTYSELNKKSRQMAGALKKKGVGPGTLVGLMVDRSFHMIIGLYGILKAGGAYLPVPPDYPPERVRYMLEDSSSCFLLTMQKYTDINIQVEVIDVEDESIYRQPDTSEPGVEPGPDDLIYVIYTSGSTGRPKGVPIKTRGFVNLVNWYIEKFRMNADDKFLLIAPIGFDLAQKNLFAPLVIGGCLCLPSAGLLDYDELSRFAALERQTIINCAPTIFYPFIELNHDDGFKKLQTLRYVFLGGESIQMDKLAPWLDTGICGCEVVNTYGPTECTDVVSYYPVPGDKVKYPGAIPIGKPVDNVTLYILDKRQKLLPVGLSGEVCIGGIGLSPGYLNNPELTYEKFKIINDKLKIKNGRGAFQAEFSNAFGEEWINRKKTQKDRKTHHPNTPLPQYPIYKTGDLGRWLADGNIEFLGRVDHQVKIRGLRIELGEIEDQILKHHAVRDATAAVISDESRGNFICAYIVPVSPGSLDAILKEDLKEYLLKYLPGYMIPAYFLEMESLPLTPSGKVNREALPLPAPGELVSGYTAPGTPTEEKLVSLWSELLGLDRHRISIDANFFEIGGQSLKATLLVTKIHKLFDVKVPLEEVFMRPTIRGLSRYINGALHESYTLINQLEKKEYYGLSSAQKRLYVLQQMDLTGTVYNMPYAMIVAGCMDKEKLEKGFIKIIARHDSLRTSFGLVNDEPVQRVHDEVNFKIEYHGAKRKAQSAEHRAQSIECDKACYAPCAVRFASTIKNFIRPFDLSQAPLLRVGLLEENKEKHLLMIDMHHIISDGASLKIFIEEFIKIYTGEGLFPIRVQYKDYAQWQNDKSVSKELKHQGQYWIAQFSDEPSVVDLPYDFPRPATWSSEGRQLSFELGKEETKALKRLALQENTTFYVILLALFNVFLSRLTGQEDIVVGTPSAGRRHENLFPIMGMFVNTLALRNYPDGGKPFVQFLHEVKDNTFAAFENQDYQFEDLVERLSVNRDNSRNPLFDIMFVLEDIDMPEIELEGLSISPYNYHREVVKFDLVFSGAEAEENLFFAVEYCTSLFMEETVKRFIGYFKRAVSEVLIDKGVRLGEIEIITPVEKEQILYQFNNGAYYPDYKTIPRLFSEQVERTPDHIALVGKEEEWQGRRAEGKKAFAGNISITYRELNEKSTQMACYLFNRGITPNEPVALMMEKSLEMIIAILGVLKAGCGYVPLNPKTPGERIRYILEDSNVGVLVTTPKLQVKVKAEVKARYIEVLDISHLSSFSTSTLTSTSACQVSPTNLAYVIYTSGSTGKPKGVPITHANFSPLVQWGYDLLGLGPNHRTIQNLAYYFDWSVWEIFISLTTGASLFPVSEDVLLNPEACAAFMVKYAITVLHITPTQYQYLHAAISKVQPTGKLESLKFLFIGAEKLTYDLVQRAFAAVKDYCRVFNMYGPTEATIISAVLELHRSDYERFGNLSSIPIGVPAANAGLLILDKYLNLCPVNIVGELFISGEGLAAGYLGDPGKSANNFIGNVYQSQGIRGSWLYKTGDRSRWLRDGNIEFLGRADFQVKIRGFRIEPGEIENQLLSHDKVRDAVVIDINSEAGGGSENYLCAYYTPVDESVFTRAVNEPFEDQLREHLSQKLPDYMVPSFFVGLEKIPLNPNGKVDRKALPKPKAPASRYTAPRNETEKRLVAIWTEVLGLKGKVSIDDNFFRLGGHSLKATVLVAKVHKIFQVKITLGEMYKQPTIKGLAKYIQGTRKEQYTTIEPIEKKEYYDLSYAQKRLWVLCQFEEDSIAYNMPIALLLLGRLRQNALKQSLQSLVDRHESFRTIFINVEGEPKQEILNHLEVTLPVNDLRGLAENQKEKQAREIFRETANSTFNLQKGPLFKFKLVQLEEEKHLLIVNIHHIINDGWSQGIIRNEFIRAYNLLCRGEVFKQKTLALQYKDYSRWHNHLIETSGFDQLRVYWLEKFKDKPNGIELPLDHPRRPIQTFNGGRIPFTINKEKTLQLNRLSAEKDATLFMGLLTLLNIFLYRYSGQEDIIIGAPIAGRRRPELNNMMGFLVNTLVYRHEVTPAQSFRELLEDIKEETLECYDYQDYPFDLLIEQLGLERDLSQSPLFNVMLAHNNTETVDSQLTLEGGVTISPYPHSNDFNMSKFDLIFFVDEANHRMNGILEYNSDLFDYSTIERMVGNFLTLVDSVITGSELPIPDLNILSEDEYQRVIHYFNQTHCSFPALTLQEIFENQVEQSGDKIAVVYHGEHFTYRELNQYANRLAHYLKQEYGVKRNDAIGVSVDRSVDMIAVLLGIIKAGAAYLAVDPTYPRERVLHVLADSQADLLIIDRMRPELFENYPGKIIAIFSAAVREILIQLPFHNPTPVNQPPDILYVNYTSGSTGIPNGAMLSHDILANLIQWQNRNTNIDCSLRCLQFTSINFCVSFQEIMGTLTLGGQLHLIGEIERQDIDYLMDFLSRHRIEILFLPFSYLNFLFNESSRWHQAFNHHLRHIITAGEQLKITSGLKRFLDSSPKLELHNHYGSTEMHVVTSYTLDASTADCTPIPPAGKPISNTRIYILDQHLNPVPVGVWGELFVCGSSEVLGYINNSRLNREKLVKHEILSTLNNNQRFYRSGDMGRWLEDGNIELRGRKDFLVKVRGFRVEPGEIESKILSIPEVKECVVVDREDEKHQKYLVAYVVKENIDVKEIRHLIGSNLPQYMIPRFVVLDSLPLMPNGKVDRVQLPEPEGELLDQYVAPVDKVEEKLVEIWAELLGIAAHNISTHADFFELGGHSLRATQMVAKIHKAFNVKVPLVEIFRAPTVSQLAEFIKNTGREQYAAVPLAEKKEYYPMSSVQRRLYYLHQLDRGSTFYNMPGVKILDPGMDMNREKLANLLQRLIRRHESLRTSFLIVEEEPVQRIHDEVKFEIQYHDIPGAPIELATSTIKNFIRPFDLSQVPLLRAGLIETGDQKQIVMLDRHHIINDGLSHRILVEEILALLREESLPPLKLQYKDYSQWQNSEEERKAIGKQGEFWLKQFEGEIPVLALPLDFARPTVQRFEGKTLTFEMGKAETAALRRIAAAEGATLFMVLITLFTIFLSKISNQEDIVIGTPVSGRRHADLEPVIGMFVNTLALRNYPGGEKDFHTFLLEVKESILQAFDNQLYPFEDLVEELGSQVNKDASRNPLFDVMVLLEDSDLAPTKIPGLDLVPFENKTSKFDLTLQAVEGEKDLQLNLEYSTSLFKEETIRRLIGCFKRVVAAVVEDVKKKISGIEIISFEEKRQLLLDFNNTEAEYPKNKTIHELFAARAEKTPNHIALVSKEEGLKGRRVEGTKEYTLGGNISITYQELNERSNLLAHLLIEKGVKPDTIVAIIGERSIETITGIFGILKAGGAYLFIDPEYPEERVNYVLKDSKVNYLVKISRFFRYIKDGKELFVLDFEHLDFEFVSNFDIRISDYNSSNLAYVIYTSGSTGEPKGVMVDHRSVVNLLFTLQDQYPFKEFDAYLLKTSILFDVSVTELFGWFIGGGRLVILGKEGEKDPQMILDSIARHPITHINFVPSMFHAFLEILNHQNTYKLSKLRYIFLAGEALFPGLVNKFAGLSTKSRLENIYGPTEGTVYSSKFSLSNWDSVGSIPIGAPLQNMKLHILNKDNHLQPVGIPGELCISGDGVSRGYLNRPELTAERFLHMSYMSHMSYIYKTGDLVRWLSNGNIEFFGRMDHQVKIRGYRIELGEIKSHLLKYNKIKDTAVVLGGGEPGDNYLCAYIVSANFITVSELKEYLSSKLPGYMIPSYFVMLEEIPLTRSGKVDRKALPEPGVKGESEYIAPRDELEKKLADLWSEVLDAKASLIGIDDSFFELGGHSIKATILAAKVQEEFDVKLISPDLFKTPTIRGLAAFIKEADEEKYAPIELAPEREFYEVSYKQQKLWVVHQLEPESSAYHMPGSMILEHKVDENHIKSALEKIIHRHESCRTRFGTVNGKVVQFTEKEVDLPFRVFDISGLEGKEKELKRKKIVTEVITTPFNLAEAPLLRTMLIKLDGKRYEFIFNVHHIIADAWSIEILRNEFYRFYEGSRAGKEMELESLRLQYKDFAQWENRQLDNPLTREKAHHYWEKKILAGLPVLQLPRDSDGADYSRESAVCGIILGRDINDQLKAVSWELGTSLFMIVFSAANLLLSWVSGQEDIVFGIASTGRKHADLHHIMGFFVNTLILNNRVDYEEVYNDFLSRLQENTLEALQHQDYPLELVLDNLGMRFPDISVLFNMINVNTNHTGMKEKGNPGEGGLYHRANLEEIKFDLVFRVFEYKNGIEVQCEYRRRCFNRKTIEHIMRQYLGLLKHIAADPGKKVGECLAIKKTRKIALV